MAITAKDVMALRQRTGLGMMECKKALNDADGDTDQAIALLRERLGSKMQQRDAVAGEGAIAVATNGESVAMVEVRSETDFAARNDQFKEGAQKAADAALTAGDGEVPANDEISAIVDELRITIKENISYARGVRISGEKVGSYVHHNGKLGAIVAGEGDLEHDLLRGICQHLIAADGKGQLAVPLGVDESDIPAEALAEAKSAAVAEAEASGKPKQIAEKIAEGKTRKWIADHTLLGQIYVRDMDAKKPIGDYIPKGAKLTSFARFEVGGS